MDRIRHAPFIALGSAWVALVSAASAVIGILGVKLPLPLAIGALAVTLAAAMALAAWVKLVAPAPVADSGDPIADTTAPPATGPPAAGAPALAGRPASNLPSLRTTFVGREQVMNRAKRALRSTRLLTLVGPGGVGKTRLALELGHDLLTDYGNDVQFVDLAAITDAQQVPQTLASTLKIQSAPQMELTETITGALRHREMLLILDNCEHVLKGLIPLTEALLTGCRRIRILATSRSPLGVKGEVTWPVPPLSIPEDGDEVSSVGKAMDFEVVRLFVNRAREVRPDFTLDPPDLAYLISICRQLGCLPLAIEIVAARVRLMTLKDLAERMEESFLTWTNDRDQTAVARMRTLGATVDWSYQLLAYRQQVLLRCLSLIAGSFDMATAVACSGGWPEPEVLDTLSGLLDSSLLTLLTTPEGGTRYRMLPTVRLYARELLEQSGEHELVANRHAAYFLAVVETASKDLTTAQRLAAMARIDQDYDDIRIALAWLTGDRGRNAQHAMRLTGSLFWYWNFHGYLTEARTWYNIALAFGDTTRSPDRARCLYGAGAISFLLGELDPAHASLTESVDIWRQLQQPRDTAFALIVVGMVELYRNHLEPARAHEQEAVHILRKLGDQWGLALALNDLGNVLMGAGENAEGQVSYERSRTLWEGLSDTWGLALTLDNLGESACQRGDYDEATQALERALQIQEAANDRWGRAWSLMALADVALAKQDLDGADRLYRQSLTLHLEVGRRQLVSDCLVGLGQVAHSRGWPRAAALLFGSTQALRERLGVQAEIPQRKQLERQAATIAAGLADDEFAELVERGRAMTPEQAVVAADKEIERSLAP